MTYRNTKTGAVLVSEDMIQGGDWVSVPSTENPPENKPKSRKKAPKAEG